MSGALTTSSAPPGPDAPVVPAGDALLAAAPAGWIVSPGYDLAWFFGGVALSLLAAGLHFGLGVSAAAIFWAWLLLVDGPHIAATLTRTYPDRVEMRGRRRLLLGSLLVFALGPACLAAGALTGSQAPFLAFLGLGTFYGYYHVVRQHWGFLALYRARGGVRARDLWLDRWALYLGCWAPYLYFLLVHPRARALAGLGEAPTGLERAGAVALVVLFGATLGALAWRHLIDPAGRAAPLRTAYLLATLALYGLVYFVVGRFEPVYPGATTPDQEFMLITVMTSVVHGVQYVGLVWFHNRNRYGRAGDEHGLARGLSLRWSRYALGLGAFSLLVYWGAAAATGAFPTFQLLTDARLGPFTFNQLGLCLWWGLALHHYLVDQYIWRVREDPALRRNLALA